MTIMMKTVIFARVSTNVQEYDRQINELTVLAKLNGWSVEAVFAEKYLEQNPTKKGRNF